jgi:hypothetical protein
MVTPSACGRKVTLRPMTTPGSQPTSSPDDLMESLRHIKLRIAIGKSHRAHGNNRDMLAHIRRQHEFHAIIAPAAALAGQLRLARRAPAVSVSAPRPRLHRYVVHHYTGIFNGTATDPAVYFSQDQRAQRLTERQHRAQAELRHHALAARQAQPRQYRRHAQAHARSWQPKPRLPQQCNLPPARLRPSAIPPSLPAKPSPLPDPAAEATEITGPQVSFNDSDVRADHAASDAASAASTIDLVAALMTLVRYVSSALAPQGRRRYTKLPGRHTQETQRPVLSAATDRWPPTTYALGRWNCAPRDSRKVRSSFSLHHGCTDGTGTRPSFEPR